MAFAAASRIARRPDDGKASLLSLIARAGSDRPGIREAAIDEFADMGAPALAQLRGVMRSTTSYTPSQRRAAVLAYNRLTQMDLAAAPRASRWRQKGLRGRRV